MFVNWEREKWRAFQIIGPKKIIMDETKLVSEFMSWLAIINSKFTLTAAANALPPPLNFEDGHFNAVFERISPYLLTYFQMGTTATPRNTIAHYEGDRLKTSSSIRVSPRHSSNSNGSQGSVKKHQNNNYFLKKL